MNICLAIPVMNTVCGEALGPHLTVAAEIAKSHRINIVVPVSFSPPDVARIKAFDAAVRAGSDYIFSIDDDTCVPLGGFTQLLGTMLKEKAVVVSGHYYRRGYPFTSVWGKEHEGTFYQAEASEGVYEIDSSGLGCALIDVKWVVENLERPYFELTPSSIGSILTEDTTFFKKIRAKGGKVLGDAGVRCSHIGRHIVVDDSTVVELRRQDQKTQYNAYYTHKNALIAALERTSGNVLELGVGYGSTPIILSYCRDERYSLSLETEQSWIDEINGSFIEPVNIKLFSDEIENVIKEKWDLVFVDFGHNFIERLKVAERLRKNTNVFIIHDSNEIVWTSFIKSFKYKAIDKTKLPETAILSDVVDVSGWLKGD